MDLWLCHLLAEMMMRMILIDLGMVIIYQILY